MWLASTLSLLPPLYLPWLSVLLASPLLSLCPSPLFLLCCPCDCCASFHPWPIHSCSPLLFALCHVMSSLCSFISALLFRRMTKKKSSCIRLQATSAPRGWTERCSKCCGRWCLSLYSSRALVLLQCDPIMSSNTPRPADDAGWRHLSDACATGLQLIESSSGTNEREQLMGGLFTIMLCSDSLLFATIDFSHCTAIR